MHIRLRSVSMVILVLVFCLLWSGCAFRTQERKITTAQIKQSPERTRMTNFMSAPFRPGSPTEQAHAQISRAALMDEAQIVKFDGKEVCLAIIQRTHVSIDVPLTMWSASINGEEAYIAEGPITVEDHSIASERVVLAADAILPEAFGSLRLTEPSTDIYRVFKREGTVCAPAPGRGMGKVELELKLPQDDARGNWGEKYIWNVQ